MKKIKRNDLCPCGSGKKYKKCCLLQQTTDRPISWTENDGIHFVAPGSPPAPEQLEKMTKEYQKRVRNSPLWDKMVKKYGKEKAAKLLTEFKAESR
ncbi:MAG: SEC-C metal-binding domain-containing protein [Desulfobacterium sp.]|jgi:hypothetical protein|nr:SEC-C metal-binding domain-containing protein [Desulfobacterium sp.]